MAGKTDKAVRTQRINEIYALLVQGARRADILQYASESAWEISERSVDYYIEAANGILEADSATLRARELSRAHARLNLLFSRSFKIKDYKTALAVEKERITLLGLAAPTRTEHTGKDGGPILHKDVTDMTDDELRAIVEGGG